MSTKKKSDVSKRLVKILWTSFAGIVLLLVLLFTFIGIGWIGYLPPMDELQNPKNKYATEIYSSDMQLLGRFFLKENRVGVSFTQISPHMVNALIATEDIRFEKHAGIDAWALGRAIVLNGILQIRSAGGGSTLTQQLAKQLYSSTTQSLMQRVLQKPIEWVIAVQLERLYTKEEILTMYLNQFDFLNNAVGIKTASLVYFNTSPDKLKIEEAALLVGMCKNPSQFNPNRFPDRSLGRRNVVLNQMRKAKVITRHEYDSIRQIPLNLKYQRVDHKDGLAPYFREYLRLTLSANKPDKSKYASWQKQKYVEDSIAWKTNPLYGFCNKNKKSDGSPYNLYNDGLRIYTTIDSRMQQYAEEAVREHISELQTKFFREKRNRSYAPFSRNIKQREINDIMNRAMKQSDRYWGLRRAGKTEDEIEKIFNTPVEMSVFSYRGNIDTIMTPMDSIRYHNYFLRAGFMSMDPLSGHVKAYVGGIDFSRFQYDMVNTGRRQVGSTIKPFLYTLAMEEGIRPCETVMNEPITIQTASGQPWTPRNASSARLGEKVTLRWALANSNNFVSAYLMSLFTPEAFVRLMRSFGISGEIVPVVSLCLGAVDISVCEMVNAYSAFPNKGLRVEPVYVTRIEDNSGNVIATFTPKMTEIFSESTSYKMVHMMQGVVDGGTGTRLRARYGIQASIGGKTGTTQNNSDGWFMGFTPNLVSGVWVGGEDRAVHFDSTVDGQGANMALPIWALYMKKIYADPSLGYTVNEKFDIPSSFNINEGCR